MIRRITQTILISLIFFGVSFYETSGSEDVVIQESFDVYIEDPGITLTIEPAIVDQITVNPTNIVITVSTNGDIITVTSADRYKFTVAGTNNYVAACSASESTLTIPSHTVSTEVTLGPFTDNCFSTSGGDPLPLNEEESISEEEETSEEEEISQEEEVSKEEDASGFSEGDLIRGPDGIRVYIVNAHGYKRHIFNPPVFDMYTHLSWDNIEETSQQILESYTTSSLYRASSKPEVYQIIEIDEAKGIGVKQHLNLTAQDFLSRDYKWEQIFIVNDREIEYYQEGEDIL